MKYQLRGVFILFTLIYRNILIAPTKQFPVDNVAATLYPDDAPKELQPVVCIGDGNCLFRAFSMVLFGDEDHHTELWIRSICELAKNEKQYLDNRYLLSLTGASDVVEKLLPGSVHVISKNPSTSYRKEVLRSVKSKTFANMWHIFSLANVLGCTVLSVYPDVQNSGTNRALMNIRIKPTTPTSSHQPVSVMWSHCSDTRRKGWGPNHFVPLLPDAQQKAPFSLERDEFPSLQECNQRSKRYWLSWRRTSLARLNFPLTGSNPFPLKDLEVNGYLEPLLTRTTFRFPWECKLACIFILGRVFNRHGSIRLWAFFLPIRLG